MRAQAAAFEEWAAGLKAGVSAQITKLRGYDAHLSSALSSKAIDIRKREADALRARIEREMAAKVWFARLLL